MKKGNINVSVENIFPLIKKFLYSDHEIFLRELISNATDATLKLKHIAGIGKEKIEVGEPKIEVKIDFQYVNILFFYFLKSHFYQKKHIRPHQDIFLQDNLIKY